MATMSWPLTKILKFCSENRMRPVVATLKKDDTRVVGLLMQDRHGNYVVDRSDTGEAAIALAMPTAEASMFSART